MTGPAYKPNRDFIAKLATSPNIAKALHEVAEKGKVFAEGLAQDFKITEEYADSFIVTDHTIDWTGKHPGPRVASRLVNEAGYAAAVEWGYKGRFEAETSSAHRVLGRTGDALKDLS